MYMLAKEVWKQKPYDRSSSGRMEEKRGVMIKRKSNGDDGRDLSAYLIVQFRCGSPYCGAIYEFKLGTRGRRGSVAAGAPPPMAAVVVRGMDGDIIDPSVKLFNGTTNAHLASGRLGSDLYAFAWIGHIKCRGVAVPRLLGSSIFNTETKETLGEAAAAYEIAPKVRPVVISADDDDGDDKFFVLSDNLPLCDGVPDPSFELFDPISGSIEQLPSPPFRSRRHDDQFCNAYVQGFVVLHGCILVSVEDSQRDFRRFFMYNVALKKWKIVKSNIGDRYVSFYGNACVVGDTIYGCANRGFPVAYKYSLHSGGGGGSEDIDISIGKQVVFADLFETWESNLGGFEGWASGSIVPIGEDTLCYVLVIPTSIDNDTQQVCIKMLDIHDNPLSPKLLSCSWRYLNNRGCDWATISCFCVLT